MKAPLLALGVASVAFGVSSIYLWHQLDEERARSAQVAETARKLDARIAELEQARAQLDQRRIAGNGGFVAGSINALSGPQTINPGPPVPPEAHGKDGAGDRPVWTMRRAEPSPAMQRMMKTQMRANLKTTYADVGARLGLSKETTSKLIDLLAEQQAAGFAMSRDFKDDAEARAHWDQVQRDNESAIADLIGADKVMGLQEYQQTIPARQEFEMLSRQLESSDARLSEDQRKKLLAVYIEERARVPQPAYDEGTDPANYSKDMIAWQDDYNKRVSDEASRILNSDQLAAYNEVQQWQKEMRENFAAAAASSPGGVTSLRRIGPGGPAGPNMMFSAGAVSIAAPLPPPPRDAKQP